MLLRHRPTARILKGLKGLNSFPESLYVKGLLRKVSGKPFKLCRTLQGRKTGYLMNRKGTNWSRTRFADRPSKSEKQDHDQANAEAAAVILESPEQSPRFIPRAPAARSVPHEGAMNPFPSPSEGVRVLPVGVDSLGRGVGRLRRLECSPSGWGRTNEGGENWRLTVERPRSSFQTAGRGDGMAGPTVNQILSPDMKKEERRGRSCPTSLWQSM